MMLLNDKEWAKWSDREIARRCAVSRELVGDLRPRVTVISDSETSDNSDPDSGSERTYTTKHGTTSTMNTENIGRPAPVNDPEPQSEEEEHEEIETEEVESSRPQIPPRPGAFFPY